MRHSRTHMLKYFAVLSICGASLLSSAQPNAAEPLSGAQTKAVETIVRDYLLNHPEIILQSMEKLREKERIAQEKAATQALSTNTKALLHHPMSPVSGDTAGDVTLVEFFDYQCGYCKRVIDSMVGLVKSDKKLRVVWKELPILGPNSRFAASAAMAAKKQGKYFEFHIALMKSRGQLSPEKVMRIARKAGIDVAQLQEDMGDPKINTYLDETIKLAQSLGIRGTPGFVIGQKIIPGAVELDQLKAFIAEERKPKS
jgi:protein-disulfide isomerase